MAVIFQKILPESLTHHSIMNKKRVDICKSVLKNIKHHSNTATINFRSP